MHRAADEWRAVASGWGAVRASNSERAGPDGEYRWFLSRAVPLR